MKNLYRLTNATIKVSLPGKATPTNPLWQGFMRDEPVCKCGAMWATRSDEAAWRCGRGHFLSFTKSVQTPSETKA